MNMIQKLLTAAAVVCTVLPVSQHSLIQAHAKEDTGKYPMACSAYEVDNVNGSGGFDKVSCHSDFSGAVNAMKKLGDDGVVRHAGSYSQTKIIAMNNGIAQAYPFRDGSSMMYYWQDAGFSSSYASTYSGQHYLMKYFETYSYNTDGTGSAKINLNGFEGYVQLKDVDLIPLRFFTDRLSITLGGNESFYNTPEKPYAIIPEMNRYRCVNNGNYKDMLFDSFLGWSDNGKDAFVFNTSLALPAAEWMKDGTTYYSYNGYDFYTDMGFHNFAGQYYNYYQFLPMRSKTNIPSSVFDQFLDTQNVASSSKLRGQADCFIRAQNDYGVNALMVYAMACLESAYGTSYYAKNRNNFFGWGAVDSNPDEAASYATVEEGIRKQMSENLAGFLDMNDWRYYGSMVGNKGAGFNLKYASAVYWGMEIAAIAYKIDKQSCGYNGNLTDHNAVNIGIVTNSKATASLTKGGPVAYDMLSCNRQYFPVYPVAVLSSEGSYYKTQCTNYVVDGELWFINSSEDVRDYDWNNSVGWISKDDVTLLSEMKEAEPEPEPEPEPEEKIGDAVRTLDGAEREGTVLNLSGRSYQSGLSVRDGNTLSAVLSVCDADYHAVKEIPAAITMNGDDEAVWSASVDLSQLSEGDYFLKLKYNYAKRSEYNGEYWLGTESVPESFTAAQTRYIFGTDSNGYITVSVSKIICASNEVFDETSGGCVIALVSENSVPVDDASMMRGVDAAVYEPESASVNLRGLAFFRALDAKEGTVTHQLILVNTETQTELVLDAETDNYDNALAGGAVDLTDVGFSAQLNLKEIPSGNYYLRIRTVNPERTGEGALFCNLENIDCEIENERGETVRFFANPLSNYRLEVSVEKQSLDLSEVTKPSRMTSLFGAQDMRIEGSTLVIDGLGVMYQASMTADDNVSYTMYFEDADGQLYAFEASEKQSPVDFAKIMGTTQPLTYASFDLSADLSVLHNGTYRMYLQIDTDDYHDVFEMYSITASTLNGNLSDKRACSVSTSNVRSRYLLKIGEGE